MAVKAFNKEKDSFVKIASLQSNDIVVDNAEFVSNNVDGALSELKRDVKSMKSNIAWIYNNGTIGGGSGSGSGGYTGIIQVENFDKNNNLVLGDADAAEVKFKIASKLNSAFTAKLTVGTTVKTVTVQPNITTSINFGQLAQGTFEIKIEATDYTGFPTQNWVGHIIKGIVTISSSFTGQDKYAANAIVSIPYSVNVSSAIKQNVTVQYSFDYGEPVVITNHPTGVTQYLYINEKQSIMSMGTHNVVLTASISPDGVNEYVVSKTFQFEVYDVNRIAIYVPNTAKTTYTLNQTATIPFNITAAPENIKLGFDVTWVLYKTSNASSPISNGSLELTSGSNGQVILFLSEADGYVAGESYNISLSAKVKSSTITTEEPYNFTFNVRTISDAVSPWNVTEDSLILYCNALGKQSLATLNNQMIWKNEAKADNIYKPGDCVVVNPVAIPFIVPSDINNSAQETNFLCLWGRSYAYVDFNIANNWNNLNTNANLKSSGCSIEFVYRCRPNGDRDAVVASYGYYSQEGNSVTLNEGFEITANEIKFNFAKGVVSNTYVMEEEWIHCTIVFEPDTITHSKTYLKVYLNGVLSGCAIANNSLTNADVISKFGKLCLGARSYVETIDDKDTEIINAYSDLDVRNLKIYSKALTDKEVVINYIADEYYMHSDEEGNYDGQLNADLRSINGFDNDKNYSINNIVIPKVFVRPKSRQIADDFRIASELVQSDATISEYDCYIQYIGVGEGNSNVNFDMYNWNLNPSNTSIVESTIKVQGTTSLQYNHKNYDICFGKWSNSNQDVLFTPKYGASNTDSGKDWLPENVFTLKADLIDSSHANNVGTANAIAAICDNQQLDAQLPPMADSTNEHASSVKYAIEGFPCALYIYDNADGSYINENDPGNASFYGVYMFDLGRNTVNNFGMQNLKINSWANSNAAPCLVDSYELIKGNAGEMYALENTFIFEGSANAADNSSIDFVNTNLSQIQLDWEMRYPMQESEVSAVTGTAYDSLRTAVVKASNYETDRDGFMDGTWNKSACILYLICSYVFGMADNLGKNLQLRTWDAKKWFPMFYDMDTVLGLNNTGSLYYDTNLDLDEYAEGQRDMQLFANSPTTDQAYSKSYGNEGQPGRGKGIYNTPNSRLWNAVRSESIWGGTWLQNQFTDDSFRETYRRLRQDVLTYDKLWGYYNSIVGSIGQMMYNEDALIKYLDKNISTNTDPNTYSFNNLERLHGTRELLTKRWLRDRLYYLDSLFEINTSGEATSTKIKNIRSYLTGTPLNITVKTKCPVFVTSTQGDQGWQDVKLCGPDYFAQYHFYTTTGNEINHNLDNASLISYVRGLYNGLSTLDMSEAINLLEVAFPGTTYLQSLTTSGMQALRTVNLRDCVNLSSVLNLSNSKFLTDLDVSNTKMSSIILPSGGTLQTFNAENTALTSLDLTAQTQLETLNLAGSTGMTSITIAKCDSLKELTITESKLASLVISDCPNLERVVLSNNSSLINLRFENCPNVKLLDLSHCSNQSFAVYEEGAQGNPKNAVDLSSLVNLEELNLNNCSAQVILLSDKCTSLKHVNATNSYWMQTVYKSDTGFEYNTRTVVRPNLPSKDSIVPAIDFSRFKDLEYVCFQNNKYVQAITGFVYNGVTDYLFNNCTALYEVTGHITFTRGANHTFGQMSDRFRLNVTYSSVPLYKNLSSLSNINLKITVEESAKEFYNMFYQNFGASLYDAYYFLANMHSGVIALSYIFAWTRLQRTELGNLEQSLSEEVFASCKGVTNLNSCFYSAGLQGTFPSRVLQPCSNLVQAGNLFRENNFTELTSDFADEVFYHNGQLQSVSCFLANNQALKASAAYAVKLDKLFISNSKLVSCDYVLGITQVFGNGEYAADDRYIDTRSRRALYITFTDSNNNDKLFHRTPKLKTCRGAFSKCTFADGVALDNNVFGGVYEKNNAGNYVTKDNSAADFPFTELQDIAYCFHDCNATIELNDKIFSRLSALTDASAFVSGGYSNKPNNTVSYCKGVTGNISDLSSLFYNNKGLTQVNRFFESTGITGTIPSGDTSANAASPLFINNTNLTSAEFLFKDCSITGNVPSMLFSNCPGLKSVRGLFYNAKVSGILPGSGNRKNQTLFKNLKSETSEFVNLDNVSYLFANCKELSSDIPTELFIYTPSVKNISYCFYGCGDQEKTTVGITGSIPGILLSTMSELTDASYMFAGCWNLTAENELTNLFVPNELFKNNTRITTLQGLFMNVPVKKVAEGVFSDLSKLTDVSYMFSNSDRSGLELPASSFVNNTLISNISYFMGDTIGFSLGSTSNYSAPTLYQYFAPNNGEFGQHKIKSVTRAFANNPNMTGTAIPFWDTTVWPTPDNYNGCYAGCVTLTDYNSIPDSYK